MKNKLFSLLFVGLIVSCSDSNTSDANRSDPSNFASHIAAYTSGVISANGDIKIKLIQTVEGIESGQEADVSLFQLEPSISGEVYWEDNRTIVFQPSDDMERGQTYQVAFSLGAIVPDAKSKGKFKFGFQIIPQNFEVTVSGIDILSGLPNDQVDIKGQLETADQVGSESLEGVLTASQSGNKLDIAWEHRADGKWHDFTIQRVMRSEDEGIVNIQWDGKAIGVDKVGAMTWDVPGLSQFRVVSARVVNAGKWYVSVMFSNPINEKQNLAGFLTLDDSRPRYVINGNEIKLYPQSVIYGEVNLKVFSKVKSLDGKVLKEDYLTQVLMPQSKPLLKMSANSGTILPNSQGLILPFEAIGLKAVDVRVIQIFEDNVLQYLQVNDLGGDYQLNRVGRPIMRKTVSLQASDVTNLNKWNRFTLNLEKVFKIQSGALYQVEISFRKHQSLFFCDDTEQEVGDLDAKDYDWSGDTEQSNWDNYEENYYGYYDWDQRDNPCHAAYYRSKKWITKVVLASDLGLIAKKSDHGSMHVFVTNLLNTDPMAMVEIDVFDYQQQMIGSATTNAEGMAVIAANGKPYVILAKYGEQYGYLKIDDGSSLSLSNFNVSGQRIQRGIKGFIYGERGVWRPGDDIFLTFILEDKEEQLPEGYPVIIELKNPSGQVIKKVVKTESIDGVFGFKLNTGEDAPTGLWTASVKVGGVQFNKSLKIESIKPNRLKIELNFKKDRLTVLDDVISGELNVKWLHGAVAKGLKAEYEMILSPMKTTFDDFPKFSFDDQSKKFYTERQNVFSGRLDQNGDAKVSIDMYVEDNPPGALRAIFSGKVYEEGGNFSVDQLSIPFYPYESFVGVKTPKGDRRGMLLTDTDHDVRIVTVDANGKAVSRHNVKVELFKLNWRWWWDNSDSDISNYLNRSYNTPIADATINTTNGEGVWKLKIKYPDWGRYYIRVTDPESDHSAGQVVFVDWPGWAGKGKRGSGGVSRLDFEIEKNKYKVGDQVKLTMPSSQGGRVLVSLETGDKIVKTFWIETTAESTVIPFEVTADMSPNVYAHLTLIQPHAQTANDLPVRMYGVQSISVVDPETTLSPLLQMPKQLEPESKFTVKVSEKNDRPMTYTIAMVDDGLLDLTRFKTPSPWSVFYAREALGVKSWDVYDDVLGAYGGKIERLLAIGGDGDNAPPKAQKANRFKPVVKYLGPFKLAAGETASHDIMMPQYVGSVRTMVVAADHGAYGSVDQTTPVKQPVMVVATLPRVAGPAEEMDLPITVFVSDDNIKSVNLTVTAMGQLKLIGAKTKKLSFDRAGEQVIYFKVKASEALGIGKVVVKAKGGKTMTKFEIEMDVRASNPEEIDVSKKLIAANATWSTPYEPLGMIGTNTAMIELSTMPPINLEQRMKYLMGYPHGCIEQTTSSVFAQLYLDQLVQLSEEQKAKITINIEQAIERIRQFQTVNGGFSYWPGGVEESHWGTNYAGHFLIEAKKKGYAVPNALMNDWIKYQKKQASRWSKGGRRNNDMTQAYRLYTLALADAKMMGVMNRMKEMDQISTIAQWRLALAYAVAGYQQPALDMIDGLTQEVKAYTSHGYTYGSRTRDRAMILETLAYLNLREEAFPVLEEIAQVMSDPSGWMSTQTTAYSLIAIVAYTKGQSGNSEMNFDLKVGAGVPKYEMGNYMTQISLENGNQSTPIEITNKGNAPIYARLIRSGIPLVGNEKAGAENITLSVKYLTNNGRIVDVRDVKQGTEFIAEVTVKHASVKGDFRDLALTQIYPSGWEIINTRMDGTAAYEKGDKPDYLDIRDDRTMQYFDLKAGQQKTFRVRLNASFKGEFYLPAIAVEAMYDNAIYARTVGQWVSVTE